MGGVVGLFETLLGHVGVNLRGGKRGVTQQRLHAAKVRSGVQQVRGEAVAELVRTDARTECCCVSDTS